MRYQDAPMKFNTSVIALLSLSLPSGSLAENAIGPAGPGAVERNDVELSASYARRLVWVLMDSQTMTEGGPLEGAPEVVLYQVECLDRKLSSFRRTYDEVHPAFGAAATVTIRLQRSPLISDRAKALTDAFTSLC